MQWPAPLHDRTGNAGDGWRRNQAGALAPTPQAARPRQATRTLPVQRPGRPTNQAVAAGSHRESRASPPSAPAPVDRGAGNRLLILILFWSMLITSVAVWWFNNPAGSITNVAAAFTAAGRITGMIGGFVLLVQLLLMSRVAWLEEWIGARDLMAWHRQVGAYLLVVVLVHTASIIVGYAMADRVSVVSETWTMLTTYEDMISAFVATGILVAVGLLAVRTLRRRMPYELWHFLHLASYLVLLLSYGHQFAVGSDLLQSSFAKWYWIGLYALVITCLVWGRLLEPLWLNLRHRLRVLAVVPESGEMFSIYLGGRRLDRLDAQAGQFFRWRFLSRGRWWQSHPFSLSAAPNRHWLRLTVSAVGDHTDGLRGLKPGSRVVAIGPAGDFTAERRTRPRALLIAGGSGIAPIRALLEVMPAGTMVIYRASSRADVVFGPELSAIARQRGIQVCYVLGSRNDPGPRHLFTPNGMRELVPDLPRRDVYLCGPEGLISAAVKTLRKLRVPRRQIHLDPFEF
jgi:predicted ferric reductase